MNASSRPSLTISALISALNLALILALGAGCRDDSVDGGPDASLPDAETPKGGEDEEDRIRDPNEGDAERECGEDEVLGESSNECVPRIGCRPGEALVVGADDDDAETRCEPCTAGEECLGGESPRRHCGWLDHDSDPRTPCTKVAKLALGAWGNCALKESGTAHCWEATWTGNSGAPCSPWA